MREEPREKRAMAFVDGQNLYHAAKEAFGYEYPNYDPQCLAEEICRRNSWQLLKIGFYTGIPSRDVNEFWYTFWSQKLAFMGSRGVVVRTRELQYRPQTFQTENGQEFRELVGREKGIDVRIALDIVRLARENKFDVALVFSQDQDLSEVSRGIRSISESEGRWIKLACAFPDSPRTRNKSGIHGMDWISIDKAMYDSCIDPNDYRPAAVRRV